MVMLKKIYRLGRCTNVAQSIQVYKETSYTIVQKFQGINKSIFLKKIKKTIRFVNGKSCKSFPLFFLNFVFYKVVFILFYVHECFASIKLDHVVY